ncbi:MAG: sulfatase [Deltaproteobacteria bacterium]|nr:sulfatase [Deltaproteobacteria bacterium]
MSFERRSSAFALAIGLVCVGMAGCSRDRAKAGSAAPSSTVTSAASPGVSATGSSSAAPGVSSGSSANAASDVPRTGRPTKPINVLLLTIDSLRYDMPWQGYPRDIAPNLTALARESVVYPRAYSVSSYTAKSVGALLSGRYPSQLYRSWSFFAEYSLDNEFFPELLSARGVKTMAAHAHFYFDRGKNLNQGFDVWRMVPDLKVNNTTDESITGDKHTDLAIDLLSEPANTKGPFFLWLHYMDPHDQYRPHPEAPNFGKSTRDHYDAEVFYTDLQVERLLAFARKQPWWEDTAVIVSSDHGEAFGEHKMWRHAFALWEVLTRVPLIVKAPGAAPRMVDARRSDIDLAPTIVDLLGLSPSPGFVGRSLVPEVYGIEPPGDREPIVTDLPGDSNNSPMRAIVKGDYKLIVDDAGGGVSLYDLARDPGETKNLARDKKHADALADMRRVFDETWAKLPRVAPYGGGKIKGGGKANGPRGPKG